MNVLRALSVTAAIGAASLACNITTTNESPDGGAGGAAGQAGSAGQGGSAGGEAGQAGSAGQGGSAGGAAGQAGSAGQGGSAGGAAGQAGSAGQGGGSGSTVPSCAGMKGTECQGESCCTTLPLPAGTFKMGVSDDECPSGLSCGQERPEHSATVDAFSLDKYEVTVGRFRRFVEQYDGTPPAEGAGAHPKIPNSGWQSAWNSELAKDNAALRAALLPGSVGKHTWTSAAGDHEQAAMNYVTWYEAMAFCIWDGGTLPTEAEWEYAAAGGAEDRIYPWGNEAPTADRANYADSDNDQLLSVGSKPAGAGKWGHQNLADGMREWTLDWYDGGWYHDSHGDPKACDNCANLSKDTSTMTVRSLRGGNWYEAADELRTANRSFDGPDGRSKKAGFRCARLK